MLEQVNVYIFLMNIQVKYQVHSLNLQENFVQQDQLISFYFLK